MGLYSFVAAGSVDQAVVDVFERAHGPEIVELGNPVAPLFGYAHSGAVIAWGWGTRSGSTGEFHVGVDEGHRRRQLGTRLALRYILMRNSQVEEFLFDLTSAGMVYKSKLLSMGFEEYRPGNFRRSAFAGDELVQIEQQANALHALSDTIEVGT